jgi:hypothetical protein
MFYVLKFMLSFLYCLELIGNETGFSLHDTPADCLF